MTTRQIMHEHLGQTVTIETADIPTHLTIGDWRDYCRAARRISRRGVLGRLRCRLWYALDCPTTLRAGLRERATVLAGCAALLGACACFLYVIAGSV